RDGGALGWRLTHTFGRNAPVKRHGVRIHLGYASPIEPALYYRQRLIDGSGFVTLAEKIARTPATARLLGAAHAYLWGDGVIGRRRGRESRARRRSRTRRLTCCTRHFRGRSRRRSVGVMALVRS